MKKGFIVFSVISALAVPFAGCEKAGDILKEVVQEPRVSLADFAITGISSDKLDLAAKLAIDNPNPVGLRLSALDYSIELAGNRLFSGESDEGLEINPSGKSFTSIPISLGYGDVESVYNAVKGRDEIPYRLSGKVRLDTPIGELPIPYDVRGKLPVVRPPKIMSVDLDVKSLSISKAKLDLDIKLYNPNNFDLDISGAGYALALDGKGFSRGRIEGRKVPAKSEGKIKVPLDLDILSLGTWAYSLLSGGSADYELSYDAKYKIKDWPVSQKEIKAGSLKIR